MTERNYQYVMVINFGGAQRHGEAKISIASKQPTLTMKQLSLSLTNTVFLIFMPLLFPFMSLRFPLLI